VENGEKLSSSTYDKADFRPPATEIREWLDQRLQGEAFVGCEGIGGRYGSRSYRGEVYNPSSRMTCVQTFSSSWL